MLITSALRYSIYLAILFFYLTSIDPVVNFFGYDQRIFIPISTSKLHFSDIFAFFLFLLNFIFLLHYKVPRQVMSLFLFVFFIGIYILVYSYFLKGPENIFADFRVFFYSLYALGFYFSFSDERSFKRLLNFIVALFIFHLLYQFLDRLNGGSLFIFDKSNFARFFEINLLGLMALISLLRSCKAPLRMFYWVVIILDIWMLIIGISRGVWIANLSMIFLYSLLKIKKLSSFFKIIIKTIFLIAVFFLLSIYFDFFKSILDYLRDITEIKGTALARYKAWEYLLIKMEGHYFFGKGLGDPGANINAFVDIGHTKLFMGSAHNSLLILFYHIGLIGLIGVLAIPIYLVYKFIRSGFDNKSNTFVAGFLAYLILILSTPLSPKTHFLFWIYIGILFSSMRLGGHINHPLLSNISYAKQK